MSDNEYLTRQTLLMRAKNRDDEQAWQEFIEIYKPFIFHIINRMNVAYDDREDLAQDVLIRLWEKLGTYDTDKGRFRSWLSFVIRNIVLNHIKKNKSNISKLDRLSNDPSQNPKLKQDFESDIDKMIEDEWKIHISTMAMENIKQLFSGNAIEVFELSLSGISSEEISQRLDIKIESIKVLKSRVKSRYMAEIKRLINNFEEL